MDKKFAEPDFKNRDVELRFVDNEVCIYATEAGLKKLIGYCKILLDKPEKGHIHLDDYDILTENSLKGVVAIFKKA
ncbi:MAG: hypothetical protein HY893_08150 [Deltaproteobacteria bacterium]|nr:hypothetical protein [Deltaproteobacteria bacterium]